MPDTLEGVKSHRTRTMSILAGGLFIVFMAILSLIPMVKTVSMDIQVTESMFGIIMGSFMVFMAFPQIPIGILSDRYGRRPFLFIGILIFSFGLLIFGLAGSGFQLLVGRSLSGLGAAMFFPTTYAIAGDLYSIRERGKGMGLISMAMGLGTVSGYILGGVVGELFGWRMVFVSMFWISLLVALSSLWVTETSPMIRNSDFGIIKMLRATLLMFKDRTIVLTGLVNSLCAVAVIGAMYTLPFFASGTVSLIQMGFMFIPFAITSSLGASATGIVSDRVGRKLPLIVMIILGGMALLLLAHTTLSPLMIAINFGFVGLCLGPVVTLSTTIMLDQVIRKEARIIGTSLGAFNMIRWLGGATGPIIAGVAIQFAGTRTSFMLLAAFVVLAIFIAFFLKETLE